MKTYIHRNPSLSWWLNQPIWKICSSKLHHLPQKIGMKIPEIFELPPAIGIKCINVRPHWIRDFPSCHPPKSPLSWRLKEATTTLEWRSSWKRRNGWVGVGGYELVDIQVTYMMIYYNIMMIHIRPTNWEVNDSSWIAVIDVVAWICQQY